LIGLVGLPKAVDSTVYEKLFKLYSGGLLKEPGVAERLMEEHDCEYV
jgi:hypothetical protein